MLTRRCRWPRFSRKGCVSSVSLQTYGATKGVGRKLTPHLMLADAGTKSPEGQIPTATPSTPPVQHEAGGSGEVPTEMGEMPSSPQSWPPCAQWGCREPKSLEPSGVQLATASSHSLPSHPSATPPVSCRHCLRLCY